MENFGILIHGGAGELASDDELFVKSIKTKLQLIIESSYTLLENDFLALDVAEHAVTLLEDSGIFNAGIGSCLTEQKTIEMDAGIMDGDRPEPGGGANHAPAEVPPGQKRCPKCLWCFSIGSSYSTHCRNCWGKKSYKSRYAHMNAQCCICLKTFAHRDALKQHLEGKGGRGSRCLDQYVLTVEPLGVAEMQEYDSADAARVRAAKARGFSQKATDIPCVRRSGPLLPPMYGPVPDMDDDFAYGYPLHYPRRDAHV